MASTEHRVVVHVQLLGDVVVRVGERAVIAGARGRRDPIRLAEYLALAPGRRAHREVVVEALWPDASLDSVGNRLHTAAHYLRRAIGIPESVTFTAGTVSLFPGDLVDVEVDAVVFERLARTALDPQSSPEERASCAERALDLYQGDLLPHELYEDWAFHHRQRLQLRHHELLRSSGRFAELVALDPVDEEARVALMRELLDAGDRAGVLRHFTALTDALERELGIGPSAEASAVRDLALTPIVRPAAPVASPRAATLADQRVSFCHTPDDVRLAYAVSGSGPPLVKASNWLTHLDHDWESPIWQPWWSALSQRHTLVRYDERGCGLSDWEVDDDSFTLEAWVRDLETVVDAMALERFPLLGISQGGPIAITYAARHPERVSHVIVYGTCARATWARADDSLRRELVALGELIKTSWGGDQPGFRQVYDARFLPDGPLESWRAFDELQRRSASARNAYRLWRAFGDLDCTEAARTLDVPTLIMHSSDDLVWSFAEAEELHSMVRGSRLVRLDSKNHILQGAEPAFGVFVDEVHSFLAS
ncbi:alpha/beta hydrolase [Phycicoccus sp. Soil802]|uniref:alpha/beta hydrolase n=1 Tax=Phycicoccus sp. Soil802 TaxID=1736414 RepID=UPI0009EB2DB3|nr:alpha/beta hydrolase [Phycicoccus sp. Soil802]